MSFSFSELDKMPQWLKGVVAVCCCRCLLFVF